MLTLLRTTMICLVLVTSLRYALAADAKPAPNLDEQLLQAIERGDLQSVTKLAVLVDFPKVANLHLHTLGSPNAKVVEFLRDKAGLSISDLQVASIRGDVKEIDALLAKVDKKLKPALLSFGYAPPLSSVSPLSLAVSNGKTLAVRKLISHGANVNEAARYTLTPLASAAELGHTDMLKLLLDSGAKVKASPDGYTPLMRACIGGQAKAAEMLLVAGADPNRFRHDRRRPLHYAAIEGDLECVKILLKHGADAKAQTNTHDTALRLAVLYKHKQVAEYLRLQMK